MELERRLKKQVGYGWFFAAQLPGFAIGYAILFLGIFKANSSGGVFAAIVGGLFIFGLALSTFIVWIICIVNAVAISSLTNNTTTALTIFSILTLWIALLIVAKSTMTQHQNGTLQSTPASRTAPNGLRIDNSYESMKMNLDNAFKNEIITSAEYEGKLKELKSKFKI